MHVPGWHGVTKAEAAAGRVRTLGIVQEQHPDRARLFMQWKRMDWPVLVDPLNTLGIDAVPVTLGIDEYGIVRERFGRPDPDALARFLDRDYAPLHTAVARPVDTLEGRLAEADALVLFETDRLDEAIATYASLADASDDPRLDFRLGVALRMRYDGDGRRRNDFAAAVRAWARALDARPNQYIWRRRIQQYGPRLAKPYPFYDWVGAARDDIRARGDVPAALTVEPGGGELAAPADHFIVEDDRLPEPDPDGRIRRDEGFVVVETTAVPPRVAADRAVRVHVAFRPRDDRGVHWNNEVEGLLFWIDAPDDWVVDRTSTRLANPPEPVSQEERRLEFEARVPYDAAAGRHELGGYALYYVCEDERGACLYRRQDVRVVVDVDPARSR